MLAASWGNDAKSMTFSWKLTWNPKWRFGRWFSFSNRWFSGSMLIFQGVSFQRADSTIQPPTIDIARKGVRRPRRFFFTSFVGNGQPQPKQNSVWITRPENWFGCQKIPWKYHEHTSTDLAPNATSGASPFHIYSLHIPFHVSKVQRKTYPLCCREYNMYDWIAHFGWIKQCKCEIWEISLTIVHCLGPGW